jgi:hypothetical protein
MKTFLWLLTLSFAVLCYACWLVAQVIGSALRAGSGGYKLGALIETVLGCSQFVWLLPLPWVVYAGLLSRRGELSASAVFIFAGTLSVAMVAVVCAVAVAATELVFANLRL